MAKADEHSSEEKQAKPENETDLLRRQTIGFVRDLAGRTLNQGLNILVGKNVEKEYLGVVSTDLARRYVRGREILAAMKQPANLASLTAEERLAVRTYLKVHDELPASLPFYDKKTLIADLDRELSRKVEKTQSRPDLKSGGKTDSLPGPGENISSRSRPKVEGPKETASSTAPERRNGEAPKEKRGAENKNKIEAQPTGRDKVVNHKTVDPLAMTHSSSLSKARPEKLVAPCELKSSSKGDGSSKSTGEIGAASLDWRSRVRQVIDGGPSGEKVNRLERRAQAITENEHAGPGPNAMPAKSKSESKSKSELSHGRPDSESAPGGHGPAAYGERPHGFGAASNNKSSNNSILNSSRQERPSATFNSLSQEKTASISPTKDLTKDLNNAPPKSSNKAPSHPGGAGPAVGPAVGPTADRAKSETSHKTERGQEKFDDASPPSKSLSPSKSASPSKSQILSVFRGEQASPGKQSPPPEKVRAISSPAAQKRQTDGHWLERMAEKSETLGAGQRSYVGRPSGLIRPWQSHIADHIHQDMLAVSDNFGGSPRANIRLKGPVSETIRELELESPVAVPRRLLKIERRHLITGPELAFAAIIALAAAARARPEQAELFQEKKIIDPIFKAMSSSSAELSDQAPYKSDGPVEPPRKSGYRL